MTGTPADTPAYTPVYFQEEEDSLTRIYDKAIDAEKCLKFNEGNLRGNPPIHQKCNSQELLNCSCF